MRHCIGVILVSLMVLGSFSGCATTVQGPKFSEVSASLAPIAKNKARAVFMRPSESEWGALARIEIDGKERVQLPLGYCWFTDLGAGEHKIEIDAPGLNGSHIDVIEFTSGTRKYFEIDKRSARVTAGALGGFIGAWIEGAASEDGRDGLFEMMERTEQEAGGVLSQCVRFEPESK